MEGLNSTPPEIYVTDEIAFEILSRMPAKSVIKHASLPYKTLLSQPHFILKQTINSSTSNGGFFVQRIRFMHGDENTHLTFHVLPNQTPTGIGIPNDSIDFFDQRTLLLTSIQGLLNFSDLFNNRICICDPVTKTFTLAPYPKIIKNIRELCTDGFVLRFNPGNQDFSNEHTLVATMFLNIEDDPWMCGPLLVVYRNGNWAEETCNLRRYRMTVRLDKPVGLFSGPDNGLVVHFLYDSLPSYCLDPYIAEYDIKTMSLLTTTKLPDGALVKDGAWMDICSFGESLRLIRNARRRLMIWVLETYTPVRWRMVVDKTISDIGVPEVEGDVPGCCVVNGKGLMFATLNHIYLYEMEGPNADRFEFVGDHGLQDDDPPFWSVEFIMYANTLRPVPGENCSMLV